MKITARLLLLLFFISAGFAQGTGLSLPSGSGAPGSTISLDLTLTSSHPGIAAAQWTFTYWAADVAGIDVAAGPAAVSAGKSISCAGRAGSVICLLWGLNTNIVPDGVVARVTVKLSATSAVVSSIGLSDVLGATANGRSIALEAFGSVLTIVQPPRLSSILCMPGNLVTPAAASCTIKLSAAAGLGGVTLAIAGGNHVTAPATVVVAAAKTSATFNISASPVSTTMLVPLTARMETGKITTNIILVPSGTKIAAATIVNGANYAEGPVAPGELVTIFGSGVGPASGGAMNTASGTVATQLAESRVLFDGIPAPLFYTRSDQVNAVVPYSVRGRSSTRVKMEYLGLTSDVLSVPVAAASPGIFTQDGSGTGQGAILNEDSSINSAANPAQPGSIVVIYATGAGQMNPAVLDGAITGTAPLPKPVAPVSVTIGDIAARVIYAGAAPGLVAGALQVNARIPDGVVAGPQVSVRLTIGNLSSQAGVTVAIQ
jgi:uncharacterized protein (TIGR03437 family)